MLESPLLLDLPSAPAALESVENAAMEVGACLGHVFQRGPEIPVEEGVSRWSWTDGMTPGLEIRLVADGRHQAHYVLVYGPGRDDVIAYLKLTLPIWTDSAPDDLGHLYLRSLKTPNYSPHLYEQIKACLTAADDVTRELATECIDALQWPEFLEDVIAAIGREEDEYIKARLEMLAPGLDVG